MLFHDCAAIEPGNETLGSPDRILHRYDIKLIEQYQGLSYEDMAGRIETILMDPRLRMNTELIADGTGVGDAAVELMRKRGLCPVPIVFGGGERPLEHYAKMGEVFGNAPGKLYGAKILEYISVPKKDLVAAGAAMMQTGRVRVAPGRWKDEFRRQLAAFKGKINEKTGNTKYEAATEADHDDLVACYLMGAWWIFNRRDRGAIPERTVPKDAEAGWDPMDYI
jgi:hypothetical protein